MAATSTEMESGEGRTTQALVSAFVLEKRAKPEEEVAGDGGMGGVGITKRPKTEGEMVAVAGSKEEEGRSMAKPAGAGKTTKLAKFSKELIEFKLTLPPLTPYPRMPDEIIDKAERPECPGRLRAFEDECTDFFQKFIDRDAEIYKQYLEKGYAEIEYTDDEEDTAEGLCGIKEA